MIRISRATLPVAATLLVACTAQEVPQIVNYQCESGQTLAVTYFEDTAAFNVNNRDYKLPSLTLDDFQDGSTRMVVRPSSGMTLQFGDEVVYWGCKSVE